MPQTFKARTPANPLRRIGGRGLVERNAFGMINLTFNHLILGPARPAPGYLPHAAPPLLSSLPAGQTQSQLCWVNGTVVDRWLTWMVHVYSVSSSSLTVQLYSRSRFLMLPLMNRLNIFSKRKKTLLPCVFRTRTIKLNGNVQVNVTLTAMAGPLRDQKQRIEPPQRAPLSSR